MKNAKFYLKQVGSIGVQLLTNLKDGTDYHIHRSDSGLFTDHDLESLEYGNENYWWMSTLTFDKTGGVMLSWSFSPLAHLGKPQERRGYALNGARYHDEDSKAWAVWVR